MPIRGLLEDRSQWVRGSNQYGFNPKTGERFPPIEVSGYSVHPGLAKLVAVEVASSVHKHLTFRKEAIYEVVAPLVKGEYSREGPIGEYICGFHRKGAAIKLSVKARRTGGKTQ